MTTVLFGVPTLPGTSTHTVVGSYVFRLTSSVTPKDPGSNPDDAAQGHVHSQGGRAVEACGARAGEGPEGGHQGCQSIQRRFEGKDTS